jgi:hypothetical protein
MRRRARGACRTARAVVTRGAAAARHAGQVREELLVARAGYRANDAGDLPLAAGS